MKVNKYKLAISFVVCILIVFAASNKGVNAQFPVKDLEKEKRESFAFMIRQNKALRPLEKIIMLKSTREEVRKLFKKKISNNSNQDTYETKNAEFNINFTDGVCVDRDGKVLTDGVVYRVTVFLKKKIRFSKFWIPHQLFKVKQEDDVPQLLIYTSKGLGVEIGVQRDILEDIEIKPPDDLGIKCKG